MKTRIVGGGWYGAHIAASLIDLGHEVTVFEAEDRLFAGASGNMPARLHLGFHYPRSRATREACREHGAAFMERYGFLTQAIPINLYAVAEHESLVDFGTYRQIMASEEETICVRRPGEFGLRGVEGALLTAERHVLLDMAREHFQTKLADRVVYGERVRVMDDPTWDMNIDCTFCALDSEGVDRYEACLTAIIEGPVDRAVTIMDGGFPSTYVWDEEAGLSSLTSAKHTPMGKFHTWAEAKDLLNGLCGTDLRNAGQRMIEQMASYWPRVRDEYRIVDYRTAIRAMPRSAADARLADVVRVGDRAVRIRAGKLDAIFHAERVIRGMLQEFER